MAKTGDDCYYFYNQTCIKGPACPFRHVEEARSSTVTCDNWRLNECIAQPCPFRHMELQLNTPCYYETQPGGCTKPDCQFRHKFPKQTAGPPVSAIPARDPAVNVTHPGPIVTQVTSVPQPMARTGQQVHPRPPWHRPPVRHGWPGARVPPPGHMFPGPPISGPPRPGGFPPYHPAGTLPGNIPMMPIEPVIINPNEESDQDSIKGSPMKQPSRPMVAGSTSVQPSVQSSNPLDYFLNAKPWVDTGPRIVQSRSPSPHRTSPYRRHGSVSPRRSLSPRRSPSPNVEGRRRSVSAERYGSGPRRRSVSLDRSRSPDWRDRRRFGRRSRSRSPPRRRSRSPERGRGVGILGRYSRPGNRGAKLEEVRVTGSKVISIKKDKKDEIGDREKEKPDEKIESKVNVKAEPSKAAPVVEEEVKSLEDIYRERALQSLMDAKRKKILENKRKRWEQIDSSKKSESDKSDKSEKQSAAEEKQSVAEDKQSDVDEKGDNREEEVDSSSDSPDDNDDDGNKSDDLPDDIDIELGEGELESDREGSGRSEAGSDDEANSHNSDEESPEKTDKRVTKSSVSVPAKPSIKSRLGVRAVDKPAQERVASKPSKRSVKDRLGIKPRIETEKPLRSGVIKLNRHSKADDILSRIGIGKRHTRERRGESKNILLLPQITIKNQLDIEDRKTGIKQRLGLLDEEENDSDSRKDRRRKRGIDEELMKLLREEEAEIEEEDLELLTKREKKKLLKKLLTQQGREDEYEALRKRKKRGFKKKRERIDEEGDRGSKRRINIQGRLGRKEEAEDTEEDIDDDEKLPSEDEIELEEVTEETSDSIQKSPKEEDDASAPESESEEIHEDVPVKSLEDLRRVKEEKEAKLRQALEPKSLEDIRRERALKKSSAGEGSIRIATGQNRRKIVIEEPEPEPVDPLVRVTFNSRESLPKRKLIRLGNSKEQNENDQPSEPKIVRTSRRERQIYIPPTVKKSEDPVTLQRTAGPPKGREIVDYGDMFPKKSTSAVDIEKKTTVKLTSSASESDLTSRPRLKLQRGPPKVEVKDATVKTFAEIMAEKKRKRLLAQQGKPYTPIEFNETESGSSSQKSKPVLGEDRLSPLPSESQVPSAPSSSVSSPVKVPTLTKSASNSDIQTESKPTRWKRRKVNNPEVAPSSDSKMAQLQDTSIDIDNIVDKSTKLSNKVEVKSEEKFDKTDLVEDSNDQTSSSSQSPVKREISVEESKPPVEKKKKMSDSFMDFDDDILNMEDADIDLELETGPQDADELMREIDELLS